jgi:DNA polymerase-3 subunit epsilon
MQRTVYLDTETTGLHPVPIEGVGGTYMCVPGIVEIALVDEAGNTLLHSLVNPWPHREWPEAMEFHHITPEMVRHAPLIHELWPAIFRMTQGARVVIYNAEYDRRLFPNGDLASAGCKLECAMLRYAKHRGVPGKKGYGYAWHKLTDAAAHVGHDWGTSQAHRALADTLAARSVSIYLDEIDRKREAEQAAAMGQQA